VKKTKIEMYTRTETSIADLREKRILAVKAAIELRVMNVESDVPCMILARGRGHSGPRVQNRLPYVPKGEQDYRLVGSGR
jgi:hypothetical protein